MNDMPLQFPYYDDFTLFPVNQDNSRFTLDSSDGSGQLETHHDSMTQPLFPALQCSDNAFYVDGQVSPELDYADNSFSYLDMSQITSQELLYPSDHVLPASITPWDAIEFTHADLIATACTNLVSTTSTPASLSSSHKMSLPDSGDGHEDVSRQPTRQRRRSTKPIRCPISSCAHAKRLARSRRDLHRHIWAHHEDYAIKNSIQPESEICPICKTVGRKDNVRRHMRTQHGMRD